MSDPEQARLLATIAEADKAIENAGQRTELVSEMLAGMGVSRLAASTIFDNSAMMPALTQQAEKELMHEVHRQRRAAVAENPSLAEKGSKKRRPAMMRGMMI
ncbi:type III secretion protein [Shewanella sp. VB17]|uniref:type III secretion protein n=1 Tax=Shewanella sp. VB17 TaxID=2739432 RepID=UPI001564E6BE|nr:type III secretion protein [Shewanella sp. VB17]NRD71748.1 type III secretion protein [Shewanella sp. VB17]